MKKAYRLTALLMVCLLSACSSGQPATKDGAGQGDSSTSGISDMSSTDTTSENNNEEDNSDMTSVDVSQAEELFEGLELSKGYKDISDHNPCMTQRFSADPGVMVYNDRVYVYATNDGMAMDTKPTNNDYGKIRTINVMSSADLVNWEDHGAIMAAGNSGAAKWAGNSWAPCACHKVIDGKEKFFHPIHLQDLGKIPLEKL